MLARTLRPFLAAAILCTICENPAWAADLVVSSGAGVLQGGAAVPITVGMPVHNSPIGKVAQKLPPNSTNVNAFYQACMANDPKSEPKTGLGWEAFCALKDQQTRVAQVPAEPVPELMTGGTHSFSKPLTLPSHPVGDTLWTLVRVDYRTPGLAPGIHHSIYGSSKLLYRCTGGGDKSKRVTCAYYTPAAWTIAHTTTSHPIPRPHP